jgi:hypothetical protein
VFYPENKSPPRSFKAYKVLAASADHGIRSILN